VIIYIVKDQKLVIIIKLTFSINMSRNNVFKLSGNIALGSQDNYPGNDLDNIKNSLKLLKAKQGQRTSNIQPEQNVLIFSFSMVIVDRVVLILLICQHETNLLEEVTSVLFRSRHLRFKKSTKFL
jgi:hypothetical protein